MCIVLIVEDDPAIQYVLRLSAEANGMQAEVASTGEAAISSADSVRPDLAIIDLGLPDRDGIDVIATIRSRSQVPIIALSARTLDKQKRAALQAGANEYIIKPFNVPELLAIMRALLQRDCDPPAATRPSGGE
jgi:two-component system KDP operon response regulator KdpE